MRAVAVHQFRTQPEPTGLARELFATYLAAEEGAVHRRVAAVLLYLDERA